MGDVELRLKRHKDGVSVIHMLQNKVHFLVLEH
jgi:hypothetical protein